MTDVWVQYAQVLTRLGRQPEALEAYKRRRASQAGRAERLARRGLRAARARQVRRGARARRARDRARAEHRASGAREASRWRRGLPGSAEAGGSRGAGGPDAADAALRSRDDRVRRAALRRGAAAPRAGARQMGGADDAAARTCGSTSATTLARLERYPDAERAFKEELGLYPNSMRAHSGLAMLYASTNRPDDVEKVIDGPAAGLAVAGRLSDRPRSCGTCSGRRTAPRPCGRTRARSSGVSDVEEENASTRSAAAAKDAGATKDARAAVPARPLRPDRRARCSHRAHRRRLVVDARGEVRDRAPRGSQRPARLDRYASRRRARVLRRPRADPQPGSPRRRGARFTFAHSHAVVTRASHASMLTGRYPYEHGVRDNTGYRLAPNEPTIATRLKALGFATGGFIGGFPLDRRFGLARRLRHLRRPSSARSDRRWTSSCPTAAQTKSCARR